MNKIFKKFFLGLVGLSFILGIIFSLNFKVDAADERAFLIRTTVSGNTITSLSEVTAIRPTVNVLVDGQASKTIIYNGSSFITWTSTEATSCTLTRSDTGTTVAVPTSNLTGWNTGALTSTTTFTVNCLKPAYCYGAYSKKVDWNGNDFDWVGGTIYDGDGGGCGYCSQRGNLGYQVRSDSTGYSWYQPTCVETGFIGCSGSRWSDNAARIDSAYVSTSCGDLTNSSTCLSDGVNPETNSYWNSQLGTIKYCTWNP